MNTEETIHTTIDELRSLLRDAEKALEHADGAADEKIAELRERIRAALAEGRTQFDRVKDTTRERLNQCDEFVRTNPYQAVGVVAVVGAFIGLLFSRR